MTLFAYSFVAEERYLHRPRTSALVVIDVNEDIGSVMFEGASLKVFLTPKGVCSFYNTS